MAKIKQFFIVGCCLVLLSQKSFCSNFTIDSLLHILHTEAGSMSLEAKANLFYETGVEYHYAEAPLEAEKFLQQSLQLAQQEGMKKLVADSYYYLGVVKFWQSDYPSSIRYLQQSLNTFPDVLTAEDSIFFIDQMGSSYFYMGDLDMALECQLQTLKIAKQVSDSTHLATSLCALAGTEKEQGKYDSALKYVRASLAIAERAGDSSTVDYCLDLMGDIFHATKDFEKALEYKIKSCNTVNVKMGEYLSAYCDYTQALTYAELGNYEMASSLFSSALAQQLQSGQMEEAVRSMFGLGELMTRQGDCNGGMQLLLESLAEAKKLAIKPLTRDVFEKLYAASKQCGRFEKALVYQQKYILYRDSISNERTQMRIASLNARQELNALELDLLHKDQRLSALYIIILCGAIAFLLLTALFMFWLYKKQQSYNRLQAERAASMAEQNAALATANQQLKAANEELEQFAFLISHDLKAPLRTMGSYASLIERRYKNLLDEEGRTFLRYITEDAKHMYVLLEDILNYSRLNKAKPVAGAVDLNQTVRQAIRQLSGTMKEKRANVECRQLPTVPGNETQLLQLFQNLLDNALKFNPSGTQPQVQITATEEAEHFRFCVQDNGIGIAPAMQAKIFAPFKRLHNRKEYDGTGVGLAICQRIVERHGGTIWMESDGQQGTSFFFTIGKGEV